MRKWLTRTLTLCTIALLAYFVIISDDTGKIPTEQAGENGLVSSAQSMGEDVRVRVFNLKGEKVSEGTFSSVKQKDEETLLIEEPDVTYATRSGRIIRVKADFLDTHKGDQQVLSAKKGNQILVQEEGGITIRTEGPLVYHVKNEELYTESKADFSFANFSGFCTGLRYRSGTFLRLEKNVYFKGWEVQNGHQHIDAERLELNLLEQEGFWRKGVVITEKDADRNLLEADHARFFFHGDGKDRPYTLSDISLEGSPARFRWGQGEMEASRFDGCFDRSGLWLEYFDTSSDAIFATFSEDDYWFNGQGGRMILEAVQGRPKTLRSDDAVIIEGRKGDGPQLRLEGKGGLETHFLDGVATSTRLFGDPNFSFGAQQGSSGNLRVLHHEHQILFTRGAQLRDSEQDVVIKGDEVLLANWDKPQREVFAFKFVEITRFAGQEGEVRCYGDELSLQLPGGHLKLGGAPARVVRKAETIEGNDIEITQLDKEVFDLIADDGATLNMITEEGTFWVEARKLNFMGRKRRLVFENVRRAVVPEYGQLSGGLLEVELKRVGDGLALDRVKMTRDVVFEGSRLVNGERRPVTCQADEMTYKVSEEIIHFHGINQDVVFSDAQYEHRNRDLKYNLKDGSLSGSSARNQTSTTTVPLDKPLKKKQNPL